MKNCFKICNLLHNLHKSYLSVDGLNYVDSFNYIWCGVRVEQVSMYHVAGTIRENTKVYI